MNREQIEELTANAMEAVESDELLGFCLNCGEEHDGLLEPDACHVECASCGQPQVFGAEECLIRLMGEIE